MDLAELKDSKVFSFDIFDTTLTRWVARPTDLFLLMQDRLVKGPADYPGSLARNFRKARVRAEMQARLGALRKGGREIRMEDIYENLRKEFNLDQAQAVQLMAEEAELEFQCVRPIAWTVAEIDALRGMNKRVIFTSDMYLPQALLERLLAKVGVRVGKEELYLSSEIGLKKHSGELFRHILKKEGCAPGQLSHCGDDLHSDWWVPHQMGIRIYGETSAEVTRRLRFHRFKRIKKYFEYARRCLDS